MSICGICEKALSGKRTICGACKVTKARRKRKRVLVEYKGGKCERCGYDKSKSVMQFHHRDPNQKDFGLGAKGYCRSLEIMKAEVDKCMLVCANCHAEIHEELNLE